VAWTQQVPIARQGRSEGALCAEARATPETCEGKDWYEGKDRVDGAQRRRRTAWEEVADEVCIIEYY
jgi:hypothetical protein